MTYEEATGIVATFPAGILNEEDDWQPLDDETLAAIITLDRGEALRFAQAFATVWRNDVDRPDFTLPPLKLVVMVEYLIGEPVWTKRYYGDPAEPPASSASADRSFHTPSGSSSTVTLAAQPSIAPTSSALSESLNGTGCEAPTASSACLIVSAPSRFRISWSSRSRVAQGSSTMPLFVEIATRSRRSGIVSERRVPEPSPSQGRSPTRPRRSSPFGRVAGPLGN